MKRTHCAALAVASALFAGCLAFHRGPMPNEPAGSYLEVLDTRVRYIDEGSGPAVVLLHGFGSALETWDEVRPLLRQSHRVIALDLRGFGWSDRPPGDYSPAAQAALVLALLDARGVENFALVGHSWGASVALAVTLAAPKRVSRLALYSAWVYEEQLPSFFTWSRAPGVGEALFALFYGERREDRLAFSFYDAQRLKQSLVDQVDTAMARPGTRAAALAAARGQHYAEVERRYASITQPVLLLWGERDHVTSPAIAKRLLTELPDARLLTYPRCGHLPMLEAAVQSTRDLIAFLAAGTP